VEGTSFSGRLPKADPSARLQSNRTEERKRNKWRLLAVVKVIEILAESTESWEAATQDAVAEAAKTVRNIQTVYVRHLQAIVEGNKIAKYRVNVKISFIVQE
jgi:dodecin